MRKRFRLGPVFFLLVLVSGVVRAGDGGTVLSGVVRDVESQPLAGILVHATAVGEEGIETRTDEFGGFALDVPDGSGPWTIQVDERELVEHGYFCVPGFVWDPGGLETIDLLPSVPLRPTMAVERTTGLVNCVRLSFDWFEGLQPITLRQWRIEHSSDLKAWTEVVTLALACPPIEIFDETRPDESFGYYRAVPVDSVIVSELTPEDTLFIADPGINPEWEGPALLIFDPDDPLPLSPVVSPVIIIRDES